LTLGVSVGREIFQLENEPPDVPVRVQLITKEVN
jgi:hypothetical protein